MDHKLPKLVIVVCALALSGCATAQPKPGSTFPIAAVIEQVKREIAAAQAVPGASVGLKLEKVEATFAVARTVDAHGNATIGIPAVSVEANLGGGKKTEESSTVYVELVPPEPLGLLSAIKAKGFGLTEAIIETREQLLKGLLEEPKLEPRKVVITVKFVVQHSGTGGAQLKLVVVSIGGGANITTADTNSVVLTFSRPRAP